MITTWIEIDIQKALNNGSKSSLEGGHSYADNLVVFM